MMPSNCQFLWPEWREIHEAATKAETLVHPDARAAAFYARRGLELAVAWLYKHDPSFKLPYNDSLSTLIYEPSFRATVGDALFAKARLIKDLGNRAAHSQKPVMQLDALRATEDLFHFVFWVARTYSRGAKPPDSLTFDAELLPKNAVPKRTVEQLQKLEGELRASDEKLTELLAAKAGVDAELERLREEIAAIRASNAAKIDTHDYSEAETRDYFIDRLLDEVGWTTRVEGRDVEFAVSGMPNQASTGKVDYVLWGDDGKPLALVEAKRTRSDANKGKQQAKLYADCLENQFGQRPVIFYSNGYEHWIWDDQAYSPREVQGFYRKSELQLLIQRRTTRKPLASATIEDAIVDRAYQHRAIRRIGEAFERDRQRKALIVMATGAGKTRTVIALSELLMRCNWAKRILFLADRNALVNQAVGAFKRHLPNASPVNLVTEKDSEGRIFVSTYPTMMGLIEDRSGDERRFGPGHFDLVIIDEAHRSVYRKYGAIFDYFDALLVGLTATPKDEIDRNTYRLFDLQEGVPTDSYQLEEAIADGVLVPPRAVSVDIRYPREGITYDELSEDEKDEWDALEWSEDGEIPERVDAGAVNSWLFNSDTVDKVLQHLMTNGIRVDGDDKLGKTIVFAKNHKHAEFIAQRFDANYPEYKGEFARVIDFQVKYAQTLIDAFEISTKLPQIAISVDMLDTGIDIPDVVNLVFFKIVRSKTKFWQMIGRGTRLRPDLFGPGQDKQFFTIFDYLGNVEYFNAHPETIDGAGGESISTRIFRTRLELLATLDDRMAADGVDNSSLDDLEEPRAGWRDEWRLRNEIAATLHSAVDSMNVDNFIVRPKRRIVEQFQNAAAWERLPVEARGDLAREIAPLPTTLPAEDEEAKRFDLLMLRLELSRLQGDGSLASLAEKVQSIAALLEEKASIPVVRDHLVLIQDIQTVEWWQDVTASMLDSARKKLRGLVKLIEKKDRKVVYTDFEDEILRETRVDITGIMPRSSANFRAKAQQFLRAHLDHIAVQRVRMNRQLTPTDIDELERMLLESGIGTEEDLHSARQEMDGKLGLFIRSLVGLDRAAAKDALAAFLSGKVLTSNQLEFVDLIINHLTERGFLDPGRLYESPYTDLNAQGVEGLFTSSAVDELIELLNDVRAHAAA